MAVFKPNGLLLVFYKMFKLFFFYGINYTYYLQKCSPSWTVSGSYVQEVHVSMFCVHLSTHLLGEAKSMLETTRAGGGGWQKGRCG